MKPLEVTVSDTNEGVAPPSFLTTEEVLGYLKVNPRTIYRLIRNGELPAIRIGRQWRFRRSDLSNWIDRQRSLVS